MIAILIFLIREQRRQNYSFKESTGFFLLTNLFFLTMGCFSVTRSSIKNEKSHFRRIYTPGSSVSLLLLREVGKSPIGSRFEAEVISVNNTSCSGKVFLTLPRISDESALTYGDTLQTRGFLRAIGAPSNPGEFDFKSYAEKKNITHRIYVKGDSFLHSIGSEKGLIRNTICINSALQRKLENIIIEPRELSLAKALLLGHRGELSQDLLTSFKGAGAMHILAISGLHVGIIHMILSFLTRPLMRLAWGSKLRLLCTLSGLWSYSLISGFAVSSIRSVSMFTMLSIGQVLKTETGILRNLINSAFVLLLLNPMFLFEAGFQLSYSALAGIAIGIALLKNQPYNKDKKRRFTRYFSGLILVSVTAQLGVLPLSLFYFKQFSGLFLFSSVLILPLLGATLIFGYGLMAYSYMFEVPSFLPKTYQLWLDVIINSIEFLGGIETLIFKNVYFPHSFFFLTIIGVCTIVLGCMRKNALLIYCSLLCIIAMQGVWFYKRAELVRSEEVVVFNSWKESFVLQRRGSLIELKIGDPESDKWKRLRSDYLNRYAGRLINEKSRSTSSSIPFFVSGKSLFCVLDREINPDQLEIQPDIIVFCGAPRLNLDRVLRKTRPEFVVVDGSNSKSFAERCRKSCKSLGINFHSTYERGAFIYPQ